MAAAGAVAAAAIVTLTNHKAGPSKTRQAVIDYIDSVNHVQTRMQAPLTRVLVAYHDFAHPTAARRDVEPKLTAAAHTLSLLGRRLAQVPAPPEARRLRSLLLELVAREQRITVEVRQFARFTPRYARLVARAQRSGVVLGKALAAVHVPAPHTIRGTKAQVRAAIALFQAKSHLAAAQQADAISGYVAVQSSVARALQKLRPPPALRPAYAAQLRSLHAVSTTGERLAAALRTATHKNVSGLGRKFEIASRSAQSVAAQRTEIAAIRAYNARVREIGAVTASTRDEAARLERTLP